MLITLIKNTLLIFYRRIKKEYSWKEITVFAFLIVLLTYGLEILVYKVLKHLKIGLFEFQEIFFLLIIASSMMLLMTMPLRIYKQLVEDRKIDILLVAPLKVCVSFGYEFIVSWVKVIVVYLVIVILPVFAVQKLYDINYIAKIIFGFFHFTTEIILIYLLFFLMYAVFKTVYIKKAIFVFGGIIDIIFTLAVMFVFNYIDLNALMRYIDTIPAIKSYYSIFLNTGKGGIENGLVFGRWIAIISVTYFVTYRLFKSIYEETGFSEHKSTVKYKIYFQGDKKKVPRRCFMWKDKIILTRDFKMTKDIFLYFLLWSISAFYTISEMNKLSVSFWLTLSTTMNLFITFQISNYIVKLDFEKTEVIALAGFPLKKLWEQKVVLVTILSGGIVIIYNLFIFIVGRTSIKHMCIINLCTFIGCIWCSMFATCVMIILYYSINSVKYKFVILGINSILYIIVCLTAVIGGMIIVKDIFSMSRIVKISWLFGIVVIGFFILRQISILIISKIRFGGERNEK